MDQLSPLARIGLSTSVRQTAPAEPHDPVQALLGVLDSQIAALSAPAEPHHSMRQRRDKVGRFSLK
jgi:hypothetical protein